MALVLVETGLAGVTELNGIIRSDKPKIYGMVYDIRYMIYGYLNKVNLGGIQCQRKEKR